MDRFNELKRRNGTRNDQQYENMGSVIISATIILAGTFAAMRRQAFFPYYRLQPWY